MNSEQTGFDAQATLTPADEAGADEVPAFWGCECALPFLLPAVQTAAAGSTLQR
jgi:hypothetical protein